MSYEIAKPNSVVVGNDMRSDSSLGFKKEVQSIFENYNQQGINLASDLMNIITTPSNRENFVSSLLESVTSSAVMTDKSCVAEPFYNNYADRLQQLVENSIHAVAVESAITGYAPITAYSPFFLKKQWIGCVWKDVLMTEIPTTPVINIGFEKRWLKDQAGNEYEMPDIFYNDAKMAELMAGAQGLPFAETAVALPMANVDVLTDTFIPGIVVKDRAETLTHDLQIFKVRVVDTQTVPATHEIPVNIKVDITTHNFVGGKISYDVKNEAGTVVETISGEVIGKVDFVAGKITAMATNSQITHVFFRGKTANRFNNRSLDVVRRVEHQQFTMPESGPRLNTAVTIEDAADALVLQKVDVIADNVDVMGSTLGVMEDTEIRTFLNSSFTAQKSAGIGPHGYAQLIVEGKFNALPYDGYSRNISDWMKESREYFERIVVALKDKLKTQDAIVVVVAHPNIIRFLQDGINWVFTDDTQISGMKVSYNFGVMTTGQDRCHVITSRYMKEEDGIKFVVIPLTKDLITYKHYKYNTVIDRGYRNPIQTLTPNIMATHRTLTFEILPVQGKMEITGRDLFSPDDLTRA